MVFHRLQAHVYNLLMQRKNVVLSASTSVGKSLVIDAILASKQYSKIVVVVPTIALIDETRRRMVKRFRSYCNIITHPSQEATLSLANVYLLTQERVLQRGDLDDVDFFVIDEFYKLDLENDSDEKNRSIDLSLAFHRLAKQGRNFICLDQISKIFMGLKPTNIILFHQVSQQFRLMCITTIFRRKEMHVKKNCLSFVRNYLPYANLLPISC